MVIEVAMSGGVFRRGKKGLYTARLQVPVQFQKIVNKTEIWQATGTSEYEEAIEFRIKWKRQKMAEWNAALVGAQPPSANTNFEIAAELAHSRGFIYRPVSDFSPDSLSDSVGRLLSLDESKVAPSSATAAAVMGLTDIPRRTLLGMAEEMHEGGVDIQHGNTNLQLGDLAVEVTGH
jgi:hypothetical protein